MDINIDGEPLNRCNGVNYCGISFAAGVKLKVSLTQKRPLYTIRSLLILLYFSDTGILRIPTWNQLATNLS